MRNLEILSGIPRVSHFILNVSPNLPSASPKYTKVYPGVSLISPRATPRCPKGHPGDTFWYPGSPTLFPMFPQISLVHQTPGVPRVFLLSPKGIFRTPKVILRSPMGLILVSQGSINAAKSDCLVCWWNVTLFFAQLSPVKQICVQSNISYKNSQACLVTVA